VPSNFPDVIRQFSASITANFASSISAWSEDQLKTPTVNLLQSGSLIAHRVIARTEAQVEGLGGRPDLGIDVNGLLNGYIELKAPGVGAKAHTFKDERNKNQWKKFKTLPNLIYTDGNEWALYRSGELISLVRFSGDVTKDGSKAISDREITELERLVRDFLSWQPIVASNPKALAELLAPLCTLIRDDVKVALTKPDSSIITLANEWRSVLFPDADDTRFADAYAQTLTYAMLLARLSGAGDVEPELAARTLDSGHGLLAQALRVLGQAEVRTEVGLGLDILIRAINAVDVAQLLKAGNDPWLYFYEDFLAAYDPKLRKDFGVYYTPAPVIQAQVRLVAELLETKFGKRLGFAEDGVTVLDPAAGTGAYPLAIIQHALEKVSGEFGAGAAAGYATKLAQSVHAFEFLVGPYAVGHLRVTQAILEKGGQLPKDGVRVYLTDTLEVPYAAPPAGLGLLYKKLTHEHERAQKIKGVETPVFVCIGNPPYDRQEIGMDEVGTERKGGWVRFGDLEAQAQVAEIETRDRDAEVPLALIEKARPILKDFLEIASKAGQGKHLKNLYNDYVYFWRWALWKVFDTTQGPGVVCFITAASYLRGPGFIGVREVMRRTFDELWIVDLEGDSLGARKTENVFAIRTPVAIALGVRYGSPKPEEPAVIHYSRIEGTRESKFEILRTVQNFKDLEWRDCPSDWHKPFLPTGTGDYFAWSALTDIFPLQLSGVKVGRTWPIASDKKTLESRWKKLLSVKGKDRQNLFKDSPTGRKVADRPPRSLPTPVTNNSIADLKENVAIPNIVRYQFRSFDRQWLFADIRIIDRASPNLWRVNSSKQIFITSLLTKVLGLGAAVVVTSNIPDLDHFCNRGGKDVIPLYRDADAFEPNITHRILEILSSTFEVEISAEELFAYAYGILASPAYVERFSEELTIPGPRLPITKDFELFKAVSSAGRTLIHVHTYGERMGSGGVPKGKARCTVSVPGEPDNYPNEFTYNPTTQTLHVGGGEFAPIAPEIYGFSVSGLEVVKSWLGYRMRDRAGRSSSDLDKIRPERWTLEMTLELLELLWVLEATVKAYPDLEKLLTSVVNGSVFAASDFPLPTEAERKAPEQEDEVVQESLL
jgi:hypothetical protein